MTALALHRSALAGAALMAGLLAGLLAGPAAAQGGFTCPAGPIDEARSSFIAQSLPSGDAFTDPDALVTAVTALHEDRVPPAMVVDNLIAAYCPVVAGNAALTDDQKTQEVRHFAARVTRVVYGLDNEDAIILDVPFPPDIMDSIGEKARQAGVSPAAWVRDVVEIALD